MTIAQIVKVLSVGLVEKTSACASSHCARKMSEEKGKVYAVYTNVVMDKQRLT